MSWNDRLYILAGLISGAFLCVCFYETYVIPKIHIAYRRKAQSRDICGND